MDFFYTGADLPKESVLLSNIEKAAGSLNDKLDNLDPNALDISDYNKRYLKKHLSNIRSSLRKYSYILSWSLADIKVALNKFVFVDHGGGTGILSLLAKELGIGTVIYNDIYDVSCRDAKVIGQATGIESDYYIEGDIDTLIGFLQKNSISCNAIASYDVIEHIYDIDEFLAKMSSLSDTSLSVVMASRANPHNPLVKRKIVRQHLRAEFEDRIKEQGHKERDSSEAYFEIRKQIISNYAPSLSNREVERLSKATRGLIEPEIGKCVEEYLRTGKIPRQPNHPTNTCDPYTGNWAEQLMDINHLKGILLKKGFNVDIKPGYYSGTSLSYFQRSAALFLNFLIALFKRRGLILSPFYTIYARKTECLV